MAMKVKKVIAKLMGNRGTKNIQTAIEHEVRATANETNVVLVVDITTSDHNQKWFNDTLMALGNVDYERITPWFEVNRNKTDFGSFKETTSVLTGENKNDLLSILDACEGLQRDGIIVLIKVYDTDQGSEVQGWLNEAGYSAGAGVANRVANLFGKHKATTAPTTAANNTFDDMMKSIVK